MKVLVTGVKGKLGYDVMQELQGRNMECLGISRDDADITDFDATAQVITSYRPDAVIHCAAYTAVDKAEDNREICELVNEKGTDNIARLCKSMGAKMIYISTDYVFPGTGDKPYNVDDATGPLGVYGETKLSGEHVVKEHIDKYFIVRISWVFGIHGNDFIKTMLKLAETRQEVGVVADQVGSPTYTADLAPLLCDMVVTESYGVYHVTNEGMCSWAELAEEAFRAANLNTKVNHISTEDYPTRATRPKNSRLSKKSLDIAGFSRLPEWRDAVRRYIQKLYA
ncbi:MAG: dTDP-4-dehydrorhamnose reductase [Desulfitobacterium sp.]